MSARINVALSIAAGSVIRELGHAPTGWHVSHLYRKPPHIVVLDCRTCNINVDRWMATDAELDTISEKIVRATRSHPHWVTNKTTAP